MLNKRVYTKAMGISPKDLLLVKKIRERKDFTATSLAGTVSEIINYYNKKNEGKS